jgi:uncharacterized membrane protein YkoI
MKSKILPAALWIVACLTTTIVFAATPEEDDAKIRAGIKANLGKATISLADALKMAVAKVPGGRVVESGFEVEKEMLFFYVEVIAAGKHQDVIFDAKAGKILGVEDTDDEDAEEKKIEEASLKAKLTMQVAIDIAQRQAPKGKPYESIVDMDGNNLVYIVSLLTTDKFIAVLIDANTGKVLTMEEIK